MLRELPPVRANVPPGSDEPDLSEQVPLNHKRVEAPGSLLRIDPMQHEVMLNGGPLVILDAAQD